MKIIHVMVCLFLMLTVLLQAGKGGGMGAAFGGGSSMGTVFGGSGAGNFLKRLTVAAAFLFMVTSMVLSWMATPSTDPLEKYFAQQQRAAMERNKAHEAALQQGDKHKGTATAPATPPAGAATTPAGDDEGASDVDVPDETGSGGATDVPATAPAPAPTTGPTHMVAPTPKGDAPAEPAPAGGKQPATPATP